MDVPTTDERVAPRILVVEDEPIARLGMCDLLQQEGYEAVGAVDGDDGERKFKEFAPDLLITDVRMPKRDGLSLVEAVRSLPDGRDVPIIILSAYDRSSDKVRGLDVGADDYLGKPVDADELLARVRVHLRHATRKRALKRETIQDELTRSLNRRGVLDALAREVERVRRNDAPLSILCVDCNEFKAINDTHGHAAGDLVLRALSALFEQTVRAADRVGRVGGDEFLIVLPDSDVVAASALVRRLRQLSPVPVLTPAGGVVNANFAIGRATLSADDTVDSLLERADQAMYADKRNGDEAAVALD